MAENGAFTYASPFVLWWQHAGAYVLKEDKVVYEPLTPILHLLPLVGRQPAHLRQLANVLAACYVGLRLLQQMYMATQPPQALLLQPPQGTFQSELADRKRMRSQQLASDAPSALARPGIDYDLLHSASRLSQEQIKAAAGERSSRPWPLPYPLLLLELGSALSNVKVLGYPGKLVLGADYVGDQVEVTTSHPVVIKFCFGKYPTQVRAVGIGVVFAAVLGSCWRQLGRRP